MSRFVCASWNLDLRRLRDKAWRASLVTMGVALGAHLALIQWRGQAGEERTAKPLTTQFIKRQPRLTKPLELRKRPRPRRRALQRQMVAVKARAGLRQTSTRLSGPWMMESLAKPSSAVARSAASGVVVLEPAALAEAVEGTRESKNALDTAVEMLDVNALDTGQYHAMVIQDPRDKRNVRGFFHLHPAYSVTMRKRGWHNMDSRAVQALANLAQAMNEHTAIRVDIAPAVSFDSRDLFKTPWVYVIAHSETKGFTITESESANFGQYLASGGFVFTETVSRVEQRVLGTAWEIALRRMVVDALGSQGVVHERDWGFEPLSDTHPLYHCFFHFSKPPAGIGVGMGRGVVPEYLEGVTLGGRLVAIVSARRYFYLWNGDARASLGLDPTRALQFGVNLLVFVLTQEGSITQRVMQTVY